MSIYKSSSLAMIPTAYKDGRLYSIRPVEQLGSELVTNGDFSGGSTGWTLGTGWTISGGKANVASGSDGAALSQDISKVGVVNKVVFTISNYTGSGFIRLRTGDASQVQDFSANGTYSFEVTPTTTTFSFARYMNGSLSIDNVSVKEVLKPSGDFDFSRGSNLAATRVASSGYIEKGRENLYTQSNNFSHSDWTPKAGTFTQGETDPNGGTDAWAWEATNTDPYLYQSKNFTGVHTLSIYVKGVGSTIGDDFQIRVGTALKDVTLTGDWQRVEHFAVLSGSINIGFEYGNPATAGDIVHIYAAQLELGTIATDYIDSGSSTAQAGILEDMPRLDYSGGATCPSLLLEPQRTNSVTQSEYLGSWTKNNSSVTDNDSISPQGVQNASAIVGDGSTNYHWIQRDSGSGTSGTTYTTSFFAKKGSVNFVQLVLDSPVFGVMHQNFDLENGTIGSGSGSTTPFIENYGNGWYRVGVTATATGTATIKPLIALANSNTMGRFASFATSGDIKIFGVQVEAGSYPTSYIPTYGSSVTRSGDVCDSAGSSTTFNDSEGVLFAEISAIYDDQTSRRITISDGTNTNRVVTGYNATSNQIFYFVIVGGSTIASGNYTTTDITDFHKVAIKYKANDFALWVDGVERHTDSSGASFAADTLSEMQFTQGSGSGLNFYGKTKQVIYFPTALTDAELASLTTL